MIPNKVGNAWLDRTPTWLDGRLSSCSKETASKCALIGFQRFIAARRSAIDLEPTQGENGEARAPRLPDTFFYQPELEQMMEKVLEVRSLPVLVIQRAKYRVNPQERFLIGALPEEALIWGEKQSGRF